MTDNQQIEKSKNESESNIPFLKMYSPSQKDQNINNLDLHNIKDMLEESSCTSGRYSAGQCLLSYNETKLSYLEIIQISFKLGFISFGGPAANLELIKKTFVHEKHCLLKEKFDNLLTVCLLLPGYSSSILLSAICTLNTKSVCGGILSLIFFNIPSLIAILAITLIVKFLKFTVRPEVTNYNPDAKYFDMHDEPFFYILITVAAGIVQAALGILIQSTYILSAKLANSTFQLTLLLISLGLYYYYDSYLFIVLLMLACGGISCLRGDQDYLFYPSMLSDKESEEIPFTGNISLLILSILFFFLTILDYFIDSIYTFLAESFFRMGAICIGEGHVIIPMILSEYNNKKLIEEAEVLNGYAIVSLLPGSLLNTASYVGVMVQGIDGGLIAGTLIFAPGFLIMLYALPHLDKIKSSENFQHFIRGANSAAMGFLFAAAIKLWIDSCFVSPYTDPILGTLNVLICYLLFQEFKFHLPYIIAFGAAFNMTQNLLNFFFSEGA